jgi:hypothetical protein
MHEVGRFWQRKASIFFSGELKTSHRDSQPRVERMLSNIVDIMVPDRQNEFKTADSASKSCN